MQTVTRISPHRGYRVIATARDPRALGGPSTRSGLSWRRTRPLAAKAPVTCAWWFRRTTSRLERMRIAAGASARGWRFAPGRACTGLGARA